LILIFLFCEFLGRDRAFRTPRINININIKRGGHECPPHMSQD
jgi:hypothetical protein